uniref:Uncharacterized protein n=1 Tax=Knipowitschia caucasica TaxID=637954 RepID=A0AAV2JHZ7_KNICA
MGSLFQGGTVMFLCLSAFVKSQSPPGQVCCGTSSKTAQTWTDQRSLPPPGVARAAGGEGPEIQLTRDGAAGERDFKRQCWLKPPSSLH